MTANIKINGVSYTGNHITMRNGVVIIDGVKQNQKVAGATEIRVSGGLVSLTCDGDVKCGKVDGNVNAGGDVKCKAVQGKVNAGGDVECGKVGGNVNAGGDISTRSW